MTFSFFVKLKEREVWAVLITLALRSERHCEFGQTDKWSSGLNFPPANADGTFSSTRVGMLQMMVWGVRNV